MEQYRDCIEQAHDLRNQACDIEEAHDRNKAWAFKIGLTRLERRIAALKRELADHQAQHR